MKMNTQPQIPVVIVKIWGCPDFILSTTQWAHGGGKDGFINDTEIEESEIQEIVYNTFMPHDEFHNLEAWEG
jgi:hypothetical protein